MIRTITVALFFVSICTAQTSLETPFFSRSAVYVDGGKTTVSPDGKKKLHFVRLDSDADDFPSVLNITAAGHRLRETIRFGLNAQVLWSPDSQAFAITGSIGGANGQYQTDAFYFRSGGLVKVPLTRIIERAFGHPVRCGWPESPNVLAVKWLDGSQTLLVAAQIIAHSNCDSFGTFKGYAVDLQTARVTRTYGQLTVKRLFSSDLGPELREADDSCIRNPKSCFVSSNHPEKRPK